MAVGTYFIEDKDHSLKEVLNIVNNFNVYQEAIVRPLEMFAMINVPLLGAFMGIGGLLGYEGSQLILNFSKIVMLEAVFPLISCTVSLIFYTADYFEEKGRHSYVKTPIEDFDVTKASIVTIPQALARLGGCVRYNITEWPTYYRPDGNNFIRIKDGNAGGLDLKIRVQDAKYSGIELVNFLNDFGKLAVWSRYYNKHKHELVSKFLLHQYDKTDCPLMPDVLSNKPLSASAVLAVPETEYRLAKLLETNPDATVDSLPLVDDSGYLIAVSDF